MAEITASRIQQLRQQTNAGMMDCKRALEEANGDMEMAADVLRKKGIAKAASRSGRVAKEGAIKILLNNEQNAAYMIELTSETDFVSRNESFQSLADNLVRSLSKQKIKTLEEFLETKMDSGKTVGETVDEFSGVMGEKISLNRIQVIQGTASDGIGIYVHSNNKIGVAVLLKEGKGQEDLAKDLCMHIAATNPAGITIQDVPAEDVAREKEILRAQIILEGKPEAMADKIVEGKIRKYYEEICLLEQNFVKDPTMKVKEMVATVSSKVGKKLELAGFTRLSIG
ncbi:MAG: translation elongation factor Ts [Candidatus Margulisiibacteriota bacterium]